VKPRICLVVSVRYFINWFLIDQIEKLSRHYELTVLVKTDDLEILARRGIEARVINAPIERPIRPWTDLRALLGLIRIFRRDRFVLVHSIGPKAGLLAMLAALLCRIPLRVHTFVGQVWVTRTGIARSVLKAVDRLIALAATHVLIDSFSQRDFLVRERVVGERESRVLAYGSLSGVNMTKFRPDADRRSRVRKELAIAEPSVLFLYMARLTRDKGALVMAEGFRRFCEAGDSTSHLIVVGPDEEGLRPRMAEICSGCRERVHFADYTDVPEDYMAAADALCLPSYREGFGTVLIDAAAVGIPAIASRIYGSEEAIQENVTGLLHAAGDHEQLAECMGRLASDPLLRAQLGRNARERAERCFSEDLVTAALLQFYADILAPAAVAVN
jgi:glycosyltransferase involved in cell wall biosynthesis